MFPLVIVSYKGEMLVQRNNLASELAELGYIRAVNSVDLGGPDKEGGRH